MTEITTMVMVKDPESGSILVQDRVKYWCGIAFPGGHAEEGESIYDSAVREVREETGLLVSDLKSCGLMYWFNDKTKERYFIFFYKTETFSGTLLDETEEGKVFWVPEKDFFSQNFAPNFKDYLPMFFENRYTEAYCVWNEDQNPDLSAENPWGIIYR